MFRNVELDVPFWTLKKRPTRRSGGVKPQACLAIANRISYIGLISYALYVISSITEPVSEDIFHTRAA